MSASWLGFPAEYGLKHAQLPGSLPGSCDRYRMLGCCLSFWASWLLDLGGSVHACLIHLQAPGVPDRHAHPD